MKYMRSSDGFWVSRFLPCFNRLLRLPLTETLPQYRTVNMESGQVANVNVDSLSAFFPGLQATMGDVEA